MNVVVVKVVESVKTQSAHTLLLPPHIIYKRRGGGGGGGGRRPWVTRDATSPEGSCCSCALNNRGERFTNATVIKNYAVMTSIISINRSTRSPMIAIAAPQNSGRSRRRGCRGGMLPFQDDAGCWLLASCDAGLLHICV